MNNRNFSENVQKSDEGAAASKQVHDEEETMNGNRKLTKEWYCDVCGVYMRSINHILAGDEAVTCVKCRGRVCRRTCSSLNEQRSGWTCKNCLRPPEFWFQGILNAIQPTKKVEIPTNMQASPLDEVDEDLEALKKKGKEQIQDFLEKLVNAMLGQNVDDASVTKTYNDELYDSIFKKFHEDLSNALTVLGTSLHNSISNLNIMPNNKQNNEPNSEQNTNLDGTTNAFVNSFANPGLSANGLRRFHQLSVFSLTSKKMLANAFAGLDGLKQNYEQTVADLPLTGQSPCTAHAALKQLIERLLKEVTSLPSLQKTEENQTLHSDLNNKTYEDLLATAILNKVISTSQNTLPSSSTASSSSRPTSSLGKRDEKEYFFGEETLDSKWKTTDQETTSISSLEEWIQSDSSFGSRKYVDRVTLTIKQDIEEVSQSDSENEEDDDEYLHQQSLLTEDKPNWFLQKRQFQGTASPVPVPMLVPSPATEAKVLIGDTEADETSDLSDAGSDYEEAEKIPATHGLLLESKTIIGGKNPSQNGGSESESSADSGVKGVGRDLIEYDDSDVVQRTDITVDDDNVEDESILSVYSNTEQEAEYTERYASLPRTILKTPTPPARPSLQKETYTDERKISRENVCTQEKESDDENENILKRQFSGIYSRREKEKWKNAIEMKNNPYSRENIEKRIKRSNSAVSALFGPDYYAKLASSPSGDKKKSQEVKDGPMVPGFPGYDEEIIGDILKKELPQKINTSWPPPRAKNEEIEDLHTAIPVIVYDSDEVDFQNRPFVNQATGDSQSITGEYTTSDSDLSYVNFYDVEKSQVYKKSNEKPDENGNHANEEDKHNKTTPETKKERPRFLKLNATTTSALAKKSDPKTLKRAQSESDLLDSSFNTPPTVLTKRKDNTLISKIYQDLRVHNFALSSRSKTPVETESTTFRTQISVPEIALQDRYNDKNALYNSDDGSSLLQAAKFTIYSSEEDLVPKASEEVPREPQLAEVRNHRLSSSILSSSSEDLLFEPIANNLERSKILNPNVFSSYEDLLSSEEYEQPPKKKDNTLISKIYQQQNVRNYALSNRDFIPEDRKSNEQASSENILSDDSSRVENINTRITRMKSNAAAEDIHLEISNIEKFKSLKEPEGIKHEKDIITLDPEINEIAKKKIVHNMLDQIESTQPKPIALRRTHIEHREAANDNDEKTVCVKELRRKFEKDQGTNRVVSSLTARSLSKQMKKSLKD